MLDAWRTAGYPEVASGIELKDDESYFTGIGFAIDYDDYLVISEFTTVNPTDNLMPTQESFYFSFGKRFSSVLIHATYGWDENVADNNLANVPTGVSAELDTLIGNTAMFLSSTEVDSKFYTLGARWEVSDSVAFKVEYTDLIDDHNSSKDSSLLQFALTTTF